MTTSTSSRSIEVNGFVYQLEGDLGAFQASLHAEEIEPQLYLVHLELTADGESTPAPLKLTWSRPIIDTQYEWTPACGRNRWLELPWEAPLKSKATELAPVICQYNLSQTNQLTFACSDVLNHIEMGARVHEQKATFDCYVHFFVQPVAPLREYRATLRVDLRPLPYYEALNQVQEWWASLPGITPSPVPDIGRMPMYSTWYSFHQNLTDAAVEHQCKLAKQYGCEAVIMDDGWQTEDNSGGYAYCGDWEVTPSKIPDMEAHVARVHALGMKCLLWFSVPFIGEHSRAYERFQGKYLFKLDHLGAHVLDPRFPEVREYLISLYEKAVGAWDFDGLKLDFVDSFAPTEENYKQRNKAHDIESVPAAVDRLLRDTMTRLRRLKPDILIEFRQNYVGPLMRNYGNLFRAADCPNDAATNRTRTLDIRLLAGNTAVHSDMLMWSPGEPMESAALQFLNILFSVPQISVKLDEIPKEHQQMLRFWITFWREHRGILLDGKLEPHHPEQLYPFILAKQDTQWLGAFYADVVAPLRGKLPDELWFVNASAQPRVVMDLDTDSGAYQIESFNVLGESLSRTVSTFLPGINTLTIPRSGLVHLKRTAP